MKTILFATGNDRKIAEARLGCSLFDVKVEQVKIDIDEIQSSDPIEISRHKALSAFNQIKKPVIISDTSWKIPALGGFPGGYMKDVAKWFTSEDFVNVIKEKRDKRISFTESIIYQIDTSSKIFSREYWGVMVTKPRGTGNSIENVAEFDGVTIGERKAKGEFSHKPEDYIWVEFAKWYSKR